MFRRLLGCLALASVIIAVPAAHAAAPRIVIVDRGGLARPIVIADWSDNAVFFEEAAVASRVPVRVTRGRLAFRLSFFWDPSWNEYILAGKSLAAICPCQTTYHGRFWPAVGHRPALFDLGHGVRDGPRRATAPLLAMLRRHHVRVRLV